MLLVIFGAGTVVYFVWRSEQTLPGPETAKYRSYQRFFQVGLAALEAGREDLARENLDQAVELIPAEPAGWANRGLLSLRKNNLGAAARDLERARQLAPDSSAVQALLGILAEKQGKLPEAVAHLRKAAAADPRDLASLFLLAETVSKEGQPDSEEQYQRLMEQILVTQPNNLPVLARRAAATYRSRDHKAFDDSLKRLTRLAPDARKILDELRQARAKPTNEVLHQLQVLDNVLKAERGYARDNWSIRPAPDLVGTPLHDFLRLANPRSTPAPPDRNLAFVTEALPGLGLDKAHWDVVRGVWVLSEKQRAALFAGAFEAGAHIGQIEPPRPTACLANAREVLCGETKIPFPGSPRAVAPSLAGVLAIDWDNDLRTDLVLAGAGGLRFWQQRADGTFADVTDKTDLPAELLTGDYYGAWAADIEMDGDLDVIVARRSGAPLVLRNNGDGTFKALEPFAGVRDVRAFVWGDFDNDGAPDAAFLDSAGKLHVFANDRSGQFSPWPLPDNQGTFLALAAADVNADGALDIVALGADGGCVRISDQNKRQSWEVVELVRWRGAIDYKPGDVELFLGDLDNNGAIDLVIAAPREALIYLADEQGNFTIAPGAETLRIAGLFDLDSDGRLDLLGLSAEGRPVRALNRGTKNYRWQTVRPLANPKAGDNRINSFGIGGTIEARAGQLLQKQPINAPVIHFGLGENSAVDVVRIVWPNGIPQWEFDLAADRVITAAQRLSGSCPFLFTYDGSGMHFAGDFMWGTPLGMFVNGQNLGTFPQTTEWLKIPGDHLVPRDGYHDVRIHANLWETDFVDQAALIVVDHPPDTEVHVDERFFITPTAPRLYLTTPTKPVARAWDHHGHDVTEVVRALDGHYLDCPRGRFQGVGLDHWVEVDLGDDAPKDSPVLLIARGWTHPTNSSLNVALAQGKHDMPQPVSLEVPDGADGWKTALPALGFPAGKDKTMLIRLDGITGPGVCRRFRLRTSMEIFWDFLGYARVLEEVAVADTRVDQNANALLLTRWYRPALARAELHYRGILEMSKKNENSPEVPHYDRVIRGLQAWRDLAGYYTRYGDVRELLAKVDDRYVIMSAGDEIAFRFPVPAGPPPGWRRDFVWEADGWTRDGDLNTRFGNSVLPLPAHGVNVDERSPGCLEDDPVYRRFSWDWRTYHTRYVTDYEFGRGLWANRYRKDR
jgi:Tfp pilus assembly protein PilF